MQSKSIKLMFAMTAIITSGLMLFSPVSVLAQDSGNNPDAGQNTTSAQNRRGEIVEATCKRVGSAVDNIINRYDENKERHVNRYQEIKQTISDLIAKLQGLGYDTSELEADLSVYDGLVRQFAGEYTQFTLELGESKALACGSSEGAYRDQVEYSRQFLKQARETANEIMDFLRDEIRPDLEALKGQNPAVNS